jgi:hypothetical protein
MGHINRALLGHSCQAPKRLPEIGTEKDLTLLCFAAIAIGDAVVEIRRLLGSRSAARVPMLSGLK